MEEEGIPHKKHEPEEIIAKLLQVDLLMSQGQSVADAVCSTCVTQFTFYRGRREYGGLESNQVELLFGEPSPALKRRCRCSARAEIPSLRLTPQAHDTRVNHARRIAADQTIITRSRGHPES